MVFIFYKPKYRCVDSEDEDNNENASVAKTKIVCGFCKYLIYVIQCVHFKLLLFQTSLLCLRIDRSLLSEAEFSRGPLCSDSDQSATWDAS